MPDGYILYSITMNQAAIAVLFRVMNQHVGNLPPMPGVFPDYPAPVVRNTGDGRELFMMRWGMPRPPRTMGRPITNVRNTSPHWQGWLKPENRCLVPANSFAEYAPEPNPTTKKKDVDHSKVFASKMPPKNGPKRNDLEDVAFAYEVMELSRRPCWDIDGFHSIHVNKRWRLVFRPDSRRGQAKDLYLDDHSYA